VAFYYQLIYVYDNYIINISGGPKKKVSWLLDGGGCDSLFEKYWFRSLWNISLKEQLQFD
jgi:hypothetical protein